MTPTKLVKVVLQNVRRNRKNLVFSSVGIIVGVAVFSFFISLTLGVREEVLNRMYPVDLLEVEPSSVSIAGAKSRVERVPFDAGHLSEFFQIPGVNQVFPKYKSRFQATYHMGGQLFGERGIGFEAYFDGLDESLLREELQRAQSETEGEQRRKTLKDRYGRTRRCYDDEDCSPGEQCQDGLCLEVDYWTLFQDQGEYIPCRDRDICASGYVCELGQCRRACAGDQECYSGETCLDLECRDNSDCGGLACRDGVCETRVCGVRCSRVGDCAAGQECIQEACTENGDCLSGLCLEGRCAAAGTCDFIRCRQEHYESEIMANPELKRGILPGLCEDGTERKEEDSCRAARCPSRSYCSVYRYSKPGDIRRDKRGEGRCERPIPVVLNPMVLEIFNLVLGSTMARAELGTLNTILGYSGQVVYGHSFYEKTIQERTPVQKEMLLVGFSHKALEAGVTMPKEYVRRANHRYDLRTGLQDGFDSIILQLKEREKLPQTLDYLEERNIQLSRRSADAEKFRTILVVAMAIFFIMASVILGIAAINITHVFLMVIYERKREIGVLRSIGATRMDIRLMFLGESMFVGLLGAVVGNSLAWGFSRLVDYLASNFVGDFPLKPETFFRFDPFWVSAAVGIAIFFSLVGAFFPANRAAKLDPARVLTMP